jgi:hypothetical protein
MPNPSVSVRSQELPLSTTELSPQAVKDVYERIFSELSKVMVGKETIIRVLLASFFSRGHCLLIGVPELAKTLLVLARLTAEVELGNERAERATRRLRAPPLP